MRTSRSRRRRPEPAPAAGRGARRAYWLLIPLALLVAAAVVIVALPATIVRRFVPPTVRLDELSGTLWHGTAQRIVLDGRAVGAVEWRLQPLGLLRGQAELELRWVDRSLTSVATVDLAPTRLVAHAVRGDGRIEDLASFGVAPGWRGEARWDLETIAVTGGRLAALRGTIAVAQLASAAVAGGADLGAYRARIGAAGDDPGSVLHATIEDAGGPLRLNAHLSANLLARHGLVSGTIAARPDAAPAVAAAVQQLAAMRGRDAAGNVPVSLDFNF